MYPVHQFKIIHTLLYLQPFCTTVAPPPAETMLSKTEFLSLLCPRHQKMTCEMTGELEENPYQIHVSLNPIKQEKTGENTTNHRTVTQSLVHFFLILG